MLIFIEENAFETVVRLELASFFLGLSVLRF